MKTASIRDVKHDFNRILAWVNNGEEVAITKHRRTVARLSSAHPSKKTTAARMPDIAGRLHKVFGGKMISDKVVKALPNESRSGY